MIRLFLSIAHIANFKIIKIEGAASVKTVKIREHLDFTLSQVKLEGVVAAVVSHTEMLFHCLIGSKTLRAILVGVIAEVTILDEITTASACISEHKPRIPTELVVVFNTSLTLILIKGNLTSC